MATNAIATANGSASNIIEDVIVKGDLAGLTPLQRAQYYREVCRSIGVNELTKPFDYITLNGKLTLYATKTATDQLRQSNSVSITRIDAETTPDGLRIVTAYARDAAGREDSDLGVVNVAGLKGDALANAYMKALTKAKRRVTLSICGLGWMDETEIESVPSARVVTVDHATGEIVDAAADPVSDAMTPMQKRKIWSMAHELDMDLDKLRAFSGAPSLGTLSKREASDLIERLDAAIGMAMEAAEEVGETTWEGTEFDPHPYESATIPLGDVMDAGDPDRFTR